MEAPQNVAGDQHAPPVVAVGDHAADRTEQHVRNESADRRRADPPYGARCGVDVPE